MNRAPPLDRFSAAGEYQRHRRRVLSMLERRFPRLPADERLELYHAVWMAVLEKRRRGKGDQIENLEAYLLGGADKLALKQMTRADARRRVTLDPLEGALAELPDEAPSPEERVVVMDDARCAREIIAALEPRERDVVKLRFDLALQPDEVRARLLLNERQYRRLIERASRKIVEKVAALDEGARSRRQLSLLRACLAGIATERQLREVQALLESDPKARALLRAIRRSAHRAGVALPLPVLVGSGGDGAARLAELVAGAKHGLSDVASGGKQQAASAYVRATEPTPLAGARPGAVAAAVAGCFAAAGGTYCAVEGVPEPILPALGSESAQREAEADHSSERATLPANARPPSLPADAPAGTRGTAPPPATQPEPSPPPAPTAPSPAPPKDEFFGQSSGTGTQGPAQEPAAVPSSPATVGDSAEFGP